MYRLGYILVLLSLISCAAPSPRFLLNGHTNQQFNGDLVDCNVKANIVEGGTGGFMGMVIFQQQQEMCMVGKGYALARK